DVCAVCLAGDDDTLRPVVAASDDPDQQVVLDKLLARQPVSRNPVLLEIAASGEGVLMPVLDATRSEEHAEDADQISLLQALEATSALVVPLRTRARTIGLLLLLMTGGSRPLAEPDLVLAQDLAGRAAMAIDNARLYTELDRRAENLSHALDSRIVVEQAKGMLAGRWGVTPGEAFERLRQAARAQRIKVHDLAQQVLDGTADLDVPPAPK
ncbi:MAG TPA: GAF and ANTAR domain-containing protein, partial [Euzebya sp.]|nr:GAF and ANTAR domain-containing protein [Euzebya sp.]